MIEGGIALVAYATLAVLVTWPLAAHPGSTFIGDEWNDAAATIAWLWYLGEEGGYHVFGTERFELTGAPFGWEQGNAFNLQWLLPYYPAYLLSIVVGEVAAYNAVVLSGLVLSALAMYALVRYLGCRPLVAGWAGLAFMLLPWLIWRVNAGHASLVHAWVFPLLLLSLHAWTVRATASRAALVGLAVAAAWLTSGYFGVMAVIGALAFVVPTAVVRMHPAGLRRVLRRIGPVVAAVVLATLVVGVASIPGRAEGGASFSRDLSQLSVYGARPAEFLVPSEHHPILRDVVAPLQPDKHVSNTGETTLYLGWLTIALGAVWLVVLLKRRRALPVTAVATSAGIVALIIAALAFAAPSPVGIAGRQLVWTPSWLLFQAIQEVRTPSRFTILAAAGLVPVAALGLQVVSDRLAQRAVNVGSRTRRARIVALLAISITAFEFAPTVGVPLRADVLPAAYRAVVATPAGILAEYPLAPRSGRVGAEYALWQRLHGRPLFTGARLGAAADDARLSLLDPAASGTAQALALLGVTTVVTRGDGLGYAEGVPEGLSPNLGQGYELVERFPQEVAVWRVVADPAPALATLRGADFDTPLPPRMGFIGREFRRELGYVELVAKAPGTVLLTFELLGPGTARRSIRIAGASGERTIHLEGRTRVEVAVGLPRGRSRISLVPEPALVSPAIQVSPPRAYPTTRPAALEAEHVSPDPGF